MKLHTQRLESLTEIRSFLAGATSLDFDAPSSTEAYGWIESSLCQLGYLRLRKADKGVIKEYLSKLCGFDKLTERSFEHRRGWIVDRMKGLASVFAIDIAAYAIMSTHHHAILHVDRQRALRWSQAEVFERWRQLFTGPVLMQKFLAGDVLLDVELGLVDKLCTTYRERLSSISWFMRCLNEPIARWANAEDKCTGRFWEGRFKSQALLDDIALLSCMTYVDLNPIRAGMATTPEASDYTSIQERLGIEVSRPAETATEPSQRHGPERKPLLLAGLMRFGRWESNTTPDNALPFVLPDYIELVDWAGRAVREGKRAFIPGNLPPIFQRIGADPSIWLDTTLHFRMKFFHAVGPVACLNALCERFGGKWLQGKRACALLYPDPSPA